MTMTSKGLYPSRVFDTDYDAISQFYGRDLGGKDFFTWKHFKDTDHLSPPIKRAYRHQSDHVTHGIIISTIYSFTYNLQHRTANIIGDLGIDDEIKSSSLIKNLLLAGHQQKTDIVICYSDDRKIAIYKKIFDKYTATTNHITPYADTLLQPEKCPAIFEEISAEKISEVSFYNNLGRKKDINYFYYLQQHPLYQRFHFIKYKDFYCVLGLTRDYAEILELSHTCDEIFFWAIHASQYFHIRCKVLLPKSRFEKLTAKTAKIINKKDFNLLLSFNKGKELDFDPAHTWISRLERR